MRPAPGALRVRRPAPGRRAAGTPRVRGGGRDLEGPFHGRGDRARRVRVGPSRPGAGRNAAPRPPASPRARAARAGRFARVFCGKTTHQVSVVCPLSSRSRLLSSRTLATVCHAINRVVNSHRGSTTSAASLLGLACARARLRTLCVPVQKRTWY